MATFSVYKSDSTQLEQNYLILFLVLASSRYALVESLGDCAQRSWLAPCLVFQVYQRVKTYFLAFLTWKIWQSSASMYSNREKKTCELASEILCCDTSSFSLQLNYSVEGCQKGVLETSSVCLAGISSQAGVIHCALYLWNKLLFPLCKGKHLWEFASQAVWSYQVAGNCVCRAHNPAGWCCLGWCVGPVWGQTA